jgi:elongation factor Ts
MAITAATVNELRRRTSQGMMECKKALEESGGDIEKAIEYFRKKGVKTSVTGREAGEGRVGAFISADRSRGALVEVLCNTDFTARNEVVGEIVALAGKRLLDDPKTNVSEVAQIKQKLVDAAQQTGENVQVGRTLVVEGKKVGKFEYTVTNKVAALVAADSVEVPDEVLSGIGLHIVAVKPAAAGLKREDLSKDLIAKEREIAIEQAKATGKPQEIAEKIAEGKMGAFYRERVLVEQEYINPDKFKGTVGDYAKQSGASLTGFARLEIGAE